MISLLLAAAIAAAPTPGQIQRELATDPAAFALADLDRDGRLSRYEYEVYFNRRRSDASFPTSGYNVSTLGLGGHDVNLDSALIPCELFVNAECRFLSRPGEREERDVDTSGKYYVDDRDGTVYGPNGQE